MEKDNAVYIGRIIKTSGTSGELIAHIHANRTDFFKDLEFVFIEIEDRLIPFRILTSRLDGPYAHITLEDIASYDKATALMKKSLYLPLSETGKAGGRDNIISYDRLIGFRVEDVNTGKVGRVDSIIPRPEQPLMEITSGNDTILIPLTEALILSIDWENHHLIMNAPEGMIDLNK